MMEDGKRGIGSYTRVIESTGGPGKTDAKTAALPTKEEMIPAIIKILKNVNLSWTHGTDYTHAMPRVYLFSFNSLGDEDNRDVDFANLREYLVTAFKKEALLSDVYVGNLEPIHMDSPAGGVGITLFLPHELGEGDALEIMTAVNPAPVAEETPASPIPSLEVETPESPPEDGLKCCVIL